MGRLLVIVLVTVVAAALFWNWLLGEIFKPVETPVYGITFSEKYAQELGIDSNQAYRALLDELGIRKVRLMSYWDLHEPNPGQYDFTTLDEQFVVANRYGATVSLVLGLRQPRWPECHQPAWAAALTQAERDEKLEEYILTVVERYRDNPALESWQLENEALNRSFGECEPPDRDRLVAEYSLVKELDTVHPIIMSLSDEQGLPLGAPVPDSYGFSVYRVFYNHILYHGYLIFPVPDWYHRLRAILIETTWQRPVIIHELQAEPWGPRPTVELSLEEQDKSMSLQQLKHMLDLANRTGIREQYLWGAEWWYWRLQQGDSSVWDTIKEALQQP